MAVSENRKCRNYSHLGNDSGVHRFTVLYDSDVSGRRCGDRTVSQGIRTVSGADGRFCQTSQGYWNLSVSKTADDRGSVLSVPVFRWCGRTGIRSGKSPAWTLLLGDGSVWTGTLEDGHAPCRKSLYYEKRTVSGNGSRTIFATGSDCIRQRKN